MTSVPMDGNAVTTHLASWIRGSRFHASLRAVLLEGLTIAGLSVIDLPLLAAECGLPVVSVDRKIPSGRLESTLVKLGMADRIGSVRAAGPLHRGDGLHFACAGISPEEARKVLAENRGRTVIPEGIRLAHLHRTGVGPRGKSGGRCPLVGEEDLPHAGRDTARPPPPRRLMGAGRMAKTTFTSDRLRNSIKL